MKRALYVLATIVALITLGLFGLFIFSAYWAIFQPGLDDAWVASSAFSLVLSVVFAGATLALLFAAEDA